MIDHSFDYYGPREGMELIVIGTNEFGFPNKWRFFFLPLPFLCIRAYANSCLLIEEVCSHDWNMAPVCMLFWD
jgi:hypothetical protein